MSMQIKVSKADFRGDPGLFGFLGRTIGKGARALGGLGIPGVSTAASFVGAALPGKRSLPGTGFSVPGGESAFIQNARARSRAKSVTNVPGFRGGLQRLIPGGATGLEVAAAAADQIGCPTGFHANKTDYFTKAEGFIPAGSKCVRNRRRNPLNPGAASKAISRIAAAKRATKALGRVTIRKECPS